MQPMAGEGPFETLVLAPDGVMRGCPPGQPV
jgi:hypothetical protein